MPEMKTAIEVLRSLTGEEWACSERILKKNVNCQQSCEQCQEETFRAHVKGYAETYPEGGE
jgi:hypothetical protein